jgi:hypothetical protein
MHQRSLNLLWCVIPVPKLAKCTDKSWNLLIVSFESQIYLNNLLNLLRPRDPAEPGTSAKASGRMQICHGFSGWQELLRRGHASGRELLRRGLTGGREQPRAATRASASSSTATSRACTRRGKAAQGLWPSPGVWCSPGATTASMARRRRWPASGRTWSRNLSSFNRLFK